MVYFPDTGRDFRAWLAVTVLSTLAASQAFAASRTKPARVTIAATDAGIPASTSNTLARFFTIRDVLAQFDARRNGGSTVAPQSSRASFYANHAAQTDLEEPEANPVRGDSEPFGLSVFRAPNGALWQKWFALKAALDVEQDALAACMRDESICSPTARRFVRIVDAVRSRQGQSRLEEANRAINFAVRYASDLAQHGELDRWSAPLATLSAGRGDCEDYAIAKYVVLTQAGVATEDLRLVLVRDRRARQDHAVLAARFDGRWLILDNRYGAVLSDADVGHFVPLYALNNDGVNLFAAPYMQARNDVTDDPAPPAWYDMAATADSLPTSDATAGRFAPSARLAEYPLVF